MNKEIYAIIKYHHLHPKAIKKRGKVYIISDKEDAYVIKLNTNNYDIYKYLLSRDFLNYPENFNQINDNYDMSLYIEDIKEEKNQKINDLLVIIGILHNKTSYLREIDLDEIKSIYENLKNKINEASKYYRILNDEIDKEIFFSPSEYLLIRNISLFYYLLEKANQKLDTWYTNIKKEKSIRMSLIHNNISIDHLIINDIKYLINWDKACFDNPINDLESFYRKYYAFIELSDTLNIYEGKNKLNKLEKDLLLIRLSIPKIINLSNDTYLDSKIIYQEILFLSKIKEMSNKEKIV